MKTIKFQFYILLFLISFSTLQVAAQQPDGTPFAAQIEKSRLEKYVYHLASAEMKGREAGTSETLVAVDYLKTFYKDFQLKPIIDSMYFNHFFINRDTVLPAHLLLGKLKLEYGKDFYTRFSEAQQMIPNDNLILLNNDEKNWPTEKIKNNAVVLLPGLFNTTEAVKSEIVKSCQKAKDLGATAIIIPSLLFNDITFYFGVNKLNELFAGAPGLHKNSPVVYISWQAMRKVLGNTILDSLINNKFNIAAQPFNGKSKKVKLKFRKTTVKSSDFNVVGTIPGKNPNQCLVIGAHYDHVGKNDDGVFFGADDNASGTAALLEIARVFSLANQNGFQPERTIIFAAFGAEELGLIGSRAFAYSGLFNTDSTSAMLNMDMIGRKDAGTGDYVYLLGKDEITKDWSAILDKVNSSFSTLNINKKPDLGFFPTTNLIHDPEHLIMRSDQYFFLRQNIPALFFTDYMKSDYHRISDTADKIDYDLLKERTQFIFLTAWQLAYKKEMLSRTSIFTK